MDEERFKIIEHRSIVLPIAGFANGAQCSQQKTEKCCCYGWHCNLKGEAKHVQKALCKKQRHQHLFINAWQKHADRNLHKDKQSDANGKAYARTSNADIRSPDDISGCTTSSMFSVPGSTTRPERL
ncbi:hypothetical protein V5799_006189 [Amblyomma americanum]|uniref:Uncharacterized protein n=1 Tax=Amblyomma americanum TaxID=6943 RepID=A0AAQ4DX40_AMBAM